MSVQLYIEGINHNGIYSFQHWLAFMEEKPFGFLMTSRIDGPYNGEDPYNKWYKEGEEIQTLDLLIGEETFLNKGIASKMIQAFLLDKFAYSTQKILIDPAEENTRAIHVYEKAGFEKIELFQPDYDPIPHWMMILDMKKLGSQLLDYEFNEKKDF